MKANELREKSLAEIREVVKEWSDELFRMKMHLYTGQLENTAGLTQKKRAIARANTIIREREIAESAAQA